MPLDGAQPSPRSPADQNAFLDVNIYTHTKKILIYLYVCVLYTWVCFESKPKAGALSPAQLGRGCPRLTIPDGSSGSTWGPQSHQPVVQATRLGHRDPFLQLEDGSQLPHLLLLPS